MNNLNGKAITLSIDINKNQIIILSYVFYFHFSIRSFFLAAIVFFLLFAFVFFWC